MKRFLTAICMFLIMTVAANALPLSLRITRYTDKVERQCHKWSKEEWDASKQEYKALIREYKANKGAYSQEENNAINKAIGRYNGLLVKHGMEELGDFLQGVGERIPSLWDGFKSVFKDEDKKNTRQ